MLPTFVLKEVLLLPWKIASEMDNEKQTNTSSLTFKWLKHYISHQLYPKINKKKNVKHKVQIIFYLHKEVFPKEPINI